MVKIKPAQKLQNNDKKIAPNNQILSEEISIAIATNIIATTPAPDVAIRIKSKLMHRVANNMHQFVFASQGKWKTMQPGVQVKLLYKKDDVKSFLLKMAPNANISGHLHRQDEESFVIEGDVTIEGILCNVGDYHFAHAGSQHQALTTTGGCTLLVKNF